MKDLDFKKLEKDLKIDARAIGIPSGAAKAFVDQIIKDTKKNLSSKKIITDKDLKRTTLKEIKKYNRDFAYVYENRDKII